MSRPIRTITSPILVLDRNDVDTDQIIPARFLTTTFQALNVAALAGRKRGELREIVRTALATLS